MDYSRWTEMQYPQPTNPNPSSTDPYARLYDADQSFSYAHYPYNPHQTHSLNLTDPQTLLKNHEFSSTQYEVGPEPGLRPPGIDSSYASINPYHPPPPTHLGLEGQASVTYGHHAVQMGALTAAAYYQETSAAVPNWAAKEAVRQFGVDPVSYAAAGLRPTNWTEPLRAENHNPFGWSKPKTRPALNGTWKKGIKKTKVVQSAWCEICKVDCNTKDVLDKHKLGKKHKKNLEKLQQSKKETNAPVATATPAAKDPGKKDNQAAYKGKTLSVQLCRKKGAPYLETGEDLETKRRKVVEGGAAADAVRVCTVCNVVCNSQTVFDYHLAGQKHANLVKKQGL
ncbi:zinc finger RNA-binding protein-like [Macadamia integrifolia]|uniref:zinc finger RNA-binding protein-like n=1 Tax=Macadamia integrifolia TaxID=60698 RepID=UPI001C4E6F1E|nr:zinc finger RNA-binding protein-like [Macadamia integrifolia]